MFCRHRSPLFGVVFGLLPTVCLPISAQTNATTYVVDTAFTSAALTQLPTDSLYPTPLPDGGALVAGSIAWADGQAVGKWVRLDSHGRVVDPAFAAASVSTISRGAPLVLPLTDGRFLLAQGGKIIRLTSFGAIDSDYSLSFSPSPGEAQGRISKFTALRDGRIAVTGSFSAAGSLATRDVALLSPTGMVDASFVSQTSFSFGPSAIGPDGGVYGVLAASSISSASTPVGRLDATGKLVATWNVPGPVASLAADSAGNLWAGIDRTLYIAYNSVSVVTSGGIIGPGPVVVPTPPLPLIYKCSLGADPKGFLPSGGINQSIAEIIPLPSGQMLVGGTIPTFYSGQPSRLMRINADGTPDSSFMPASLAGLTVESLQAQDSGWLAVLAQASGMYSLVSFDGAFGVQRDFTPDLRQSAQIQSSSALPDGSVLYAGTFADSTGVVRHFLRLMPDGSQDFSRVPHTPEAATARVAAVSSSGDVYLIASSPIGSPSLQANEVERYSIDGEWDAPFGRRTPVTPHMSLTGILIDRLGRILLECDPAHLERLLPSGSPDTSFYFSGTVALTSGIASAVVCGTEASYVVADRSGDVTFVDDAGGIVFSGPSPYQISQLRYLLAAGGGAYGYGSFSSAFDTPTFGVAQLGLNGTNLDWRSGLRANSDVISAQNLPDGRILLTGSLMLAGQGTRSAAILQAAGGVDPNEPLIASSTMTVAADGRIYAITDGRLARLQARSRPSVALAGASGPSSVGDSLSLQASTPNAAGTTWSWSKDGAPLSGQIAASLNLPSLTAADFGWYTVQATTVSGTVSASIYVSVKIDGARIANASARSFVGPGNLQATVGFVVQGKSSQPALFRVLGDALTAFGVANATTSQGGGFFANGVTLAVLFFYPGNQFFYYGSESPAQVAGLAGAFPLPSTISNNTQMLANFSPGVAYSKQRSAPPDQAGIGLTELYLPESGSDPAAGRRIRNFSCLAQATNGSGVIILGFSLAGNAPSPVLIRGVGPGLGRFSISGALSDPVLSLYRGATLVATNADWHGQTNASAIASAAAQVGAFPLNSGDDAGMLLTLDPGVYTAVLQPAQSAGGIGLLELYDTAVVPVSTIAQAILAGQ